MNSSSHRQMQIKIGDKVYPISPTQESCMEYLQEHRTMESILKNQFNPEVKLGQFVENYHFEKVLEIIDKFSGMLPNPINVRSSSPVESIGQKMSEILSAFHYQDLQRMYLVAHCLKIHSLKRSIAAHFAAKVYAKDQDEYNQKKALYGIKKDISIHTSLEYKNLSFMNNYGKH